MPPFLLRQQRKFQLDLFIKVGEVDAQQPDSVASVPCFSEEIHHRPVHCGIIVGRFDGLRPGDGFKIGKAKLQAHRPDPPPLGPKRRADILHKHIEHLLQLSLVSTIVSESLFVADALSRVLGADIVAAFPMHDVMKPDAVGAKQVNKPLRGNCLKIGLLPVQLPSDVQTLEVFDRAVDSAETDVEGAAHLDPRQTLSGCGMGGPTACWKPAQFRQAPCGAQISMAAEFPLARGSLAAVPLPRSAGLV